MRKFMKNLCCLAAAIIFNGINMQAADKMPIPLVVEAALDSSGNNRTELEVVLEHYSNLNDTLKYLAATYLIGNMEGHSYVTFDLRDSLKNEVSFNVPDYPTYDSLQAAWRILEKEHGTLDFKRRDIIYDLKTVKADYLINQIDLAFRAWWEKPWAKNIPEEIFFNYVLPYRSSNEPVEPWREYFLDKYRDLSRQMADSTDPLEAARLINRDVMGWFRFDPRWYYHPTDQGLAEMLAGQLGRCEDMNNIVNYAMRANGLAVTSDYTPHWANSGNNHAWNAIVLPDGKVIPFMGAEANPGEYQLANKLAKAYRKTYAKQPGNLIFQSRKQEKVPGWLAGKSYIDVTSEYVPVCDVAIAPEIPVPDSVDIAYLCVFNSGEWQPIQWGRIVEGKVTFKAMGRDIAYLPAFYMNEKVVPCGSPFILETDCTVRSLLPDSATSVTVHLAATTKPAQVASTDGTAMSHLTEGQEYELFQWQGEWKSSGMATAGKEPLKFEKVPGGALYWLVAKGSDKEERIFTFENGSQVWW